MIPLKSRLDQTKTNPWWWEANQNYKQMEQLQQSLMTSQSELGGLI